MRRLKRSLPLESPLIPSPRDPAKPISPQTLIKWAWLASKELGFPVHTHRLRHTFATRALEEGISLDVLQELMGHARLETTRRYAETTEARRRREIQRIKRKGGIRRAR